MVPLFILAIRKGFIKGFIGCGLVFGIISCLLDGYGFIFFPFDYLMGFGFIAIIGLFRNRILISNTRTSIFYMMIGTIIALFGRIISSTVSGIIFYNMNFITSLIYQLTYIGPSGVLVIVLLIILINIK